MTAEKAACGITLIVRYLVSIRERTGKREELVSFPTGSTLQDVSTWLHETYGIVIPNPQLMATLNGRGWSQYPEALSTVLNEGDTISIFPPIAGG